jgi:hypothetical protein
MQDGARIELVTYAAIWISAVIYTIYSFVITSNKYFSYYIDSYSDFTEGWTFLSRKKDVADLEWETIKFSLERSYLWIILLLFISEILRKFKFVRVIFFLIHSRKSERPNLSVTDSSTVADTYFYCIYFNRTGAISIISDTVPTLNFFNCINLSQ